jgi:hypothetical protein
MLRWRWTSLHLWPFAMQQASYLNNHLPGKDGLAKTKVFCETQSPIKMKNLHTFGYPVWYVLVEPLQSGNSVPHFHHRTRIGIYVGHSPQHAGNVALILNPHTGCTSPQYHMVFDDNFTMVNDIKNSLTPSTWQQLVSKYEGASEIDYDLAKLWFDHSDLRHLRVLPNGGNTDPQQDEQPLAALQVTKHINVKQISSSLMVPTKPPPEDDTGRAQAAAPRVNFTIDTNILKGYCATPILKHHTRPVTRPSGRNQRRSSRSQTISTHSFRKWATRLRRKAHGYPVC